MTQMKNLARRKGIKQFAFDRPVIFSLLVILAALFLSEIPLSGIFIPWLDNPGANFLSGILVQSLVGFVLIGLLVRLDLFEKARFTPPSQWKSVWLVWPLVLIALLNSSSLIDGTLTLDTSHPGLILLYIGLVLSIGFFEETLGRGVILPVLLQKWGNTQRGIYLAVLVSSALFGVAHLINVIMGRLPMLSALTQIIYAFFFAVIFAACFLRNNSIWPVIMMHAAMDFGGDMVQEITRNRGSQMAATNSTMEEALLTLILTLPLFLYGLFILRKVAPAQQDDKTFEPLIVTPQPSSAD